MWWMDNLVALVAVGISVLSLVVSLVVTARYADAHFDVSVAPVTMVTANGIADISLTLRNDGQNLARQVRVRLLADPLGVYARLRPNRWHTLSAGEVVRFDVEGYAYSDGAGAGHENRFNRTFVDAENPEARLIEVRWKTPLWFPAKQTYSLPRVPSEPEYSSAEVREAMESIRKGAA
jgi:hypothetical protein